MRLKQKIKYAVACLFELAKRAGDYVDAEHIAHQQKIPAAYAHKILQVLAHAGFVFSLKGRGYKLARPLENITALEVIETLTVDEDPNATNPDIGILLETRVNKALGSFTLGELVHGH